MKRVVSVSLGSDKRNHSVQTEIMGEQFTLERIGVNGDVNKAKQMIRELDGKVDAIGLGGTDLYIHSKNKCYAFRESKQLRNCAPHTPVTDGSFLKNTMENRLIYYIKNELGITLSGKKALLMSGVDRYGMARALDDCGTDMVIGDLIFAVGLPIKISSLKQLDRAAAMLAPLLTKLPIKMLYPTGASQNKNNPKYHKYFDGIEFVCGDYIFIKKNMPDNMKGKIVITNTVTSEDLDELRRRGTKMLITGTPELEGRSFGTNVMEGVIAACAGKSPDQMTTEEFSNWLKKVSFVPRVLEF